MDAKRCSPARSDMSSMYSGADVWFDLCVLPNCWMALSADHGSSSVMCTLRFLFLTLLSAWSEMPLDAASEMTATHFSPDMNLSFSARLSVSSGTSCSDRDS